MIFRDTSRLHLLGFAAADGFVVQIGDPEGPAEGFIDPSTEKSWLMGRKHLSMEQH